METEAETRVADLLNYMIRRFSVTHPHAAIGKLPTRLRRRLSFVSASIRYFLNDFKRRQEFLDRIELDTCQRCVFFTQQTIQLLFIDFSLTRFGIVCFLLFERRTRIDDGNLLKIRRLKREFGVDATPPTRMKKLESKTVSFFKSASRP